MSTLSPWCDMHWMKTQDFNAINEMTGHRTRCCLLTAG